MARKFVFALHRDAPPRAPPLAVGTAVEARLSTALEMAWSMRIGRLNRSE